LSTLGANVMAMGVMGSIAGFVTFKLLRGLVLIGAMALTAFALFVGGGDHD